MPIQTQFPTTFVGPIYLLGPFRFSTAQSAPLTSPYTEAGAAGSLTRTDAANRMSIATGQLTSTGPTNWGQNIGYASTPLARLAGRVLLATWRRTAGGYGPVVGFATNPARFSPDFSDVEAGCYAATNLRVSGTGVSLAVATVSTNVPYDAAIILRTAGFFALQRQGTGAYTLLWVHNSGSTATLTPGWTSYDAAYDIDDLRVTDLGGAWVDDYGIALARSTFTAANDTNVTVVTPEVGSAWTVLSGTLVVNSNTIRATGASGSGSDASAVVDTGQSDVIVECQLVWATGGTEGIIIRATDDANSWLVAINNTTAYILQKTAGGYTSRATAALTTTNGQSRRLVVTAVGAVINFYVDNVLYCTYSSATQGQSATQHGIRLNTISGTTIDNFIVWPRTVSLPAGV